MSFAADMKDFVSAFKTGADIGNSFRKLDQEDTKRDQTDRGLDQRDRSLDQEDRRIDQSGKKGQSADDEEWARDTGYVNTSKTTGGAKAGGSGGKAKEYMSYLVDKKGMNPNVAAGIVGNLQQESGLDHTRVGDNGASFGLFQANKNGEGPAFRRWAATNGRDIKTDAYSHLDYLADALQKGPYKGLYERMASAKDPMQAAVLFQNGFERPNPKYANTPARQQYAQNARSLYTPAALSTQVASQAPSQPEEPDDEDGFECGGMVRGYAEGGVVEDTVDQDNGSYWRQENARQQALPTSAPAPAAPAPAPALAISDTATDGTPTPPPRPNLERAALSPEERSYTAIDGDPLERAIDGGLKEIQNKYIKPSAVPTGGDYGARALFTGNTDAASKDDIHTLERLGDPEGKMPPELARVKGFSMLYEKYESQGKHALANRAAASLIRYGQVVAQSLGSQAMQALQSNDIEGAKKLLISAYNQVPDGQHAEIVNNQLVMKDMDGKVVKAMPMPGPQQVYEMAKVTANGSGYYQMLMDRMSAARSRSASAGAQGPTPEQQEEFQKYQQGTGAAPTQQGNPAPPTEPQQPAPAPTTDDNPVRVAEGPKTTATDGTAAMPKTFMPQKQQAPIPPMPQEPNLSAMHPKDRADAMRVYRARKDSYDKAVKAAKAPEDEIDYEGTHKEVSKAFETFVEENTSDDPKVPSLSFKPKEKIAIRDVATQLRASNPTMTSERAVEVAVHILGKNPDGSDTPTYKSMRAEDGSMALMLSDGSKMVLSPDGARRLDQVMKARASKAEADKKAADEAAKPSRFSKGVDKVVDYAKEKFSERNPEKDKIMQERRAKQQAFRDSAIPAPAAAPPAPPRKALGLIRADSDFPRATPAELARRAIPTN